MMRKRLVHSSKLEIRTSTYHIAVYAYGNGRHSAETQLADSTMIINDADSLEEVLAVHKNILSLAVQAREIRQQTRNAWGWRFFKSSRK
ncbi:hypothetical protein [Geotalea sp. SG265]|uniref:hypothetical protein n=1 Tax=Geotalea sp. SG265 TaxID=2922867 RepID=UPI001FAFF7D3|nr:hypothetical protein [Geotalea sp. SG265]